MSGWLSHESSALEFDLVIIGAGINGAAVARDASMRGLRVLLLEKNDIGSGTTAWSTRLIHGGLRYLEHAEIGLVRESLREREILLRIAPHLVKPIPIVLPIYVGQRRGSFTVRTGMIAYDLLSFDKSLNAHRRLSRSELLLLAPGINQEGLRSAFLYYDAQVEFAERLTLETVLSAVENGAQVKTYATVDGFLTADERINGVTYTDQLTGKRFDVRSRLIINASGPWVDLLLDGSHPSSAPPLIGGTKGSHLIVQSFSGAPTTAVYVEAAVDHRPIFVIPWNGKYLIGTTDIRYSGSLDNVVISEQEIEYLLNETNRLFPTAHLSRDSILFTYSGIRPLAYANNKDEEAITRRHFIHEDPLNGLISLVGGKLTTHRRLAAQTVDLCCRRLAREVPESATATIRLPGACPPDFAGFDEQFKEQSPLPTFGAERLLRVYGFRALQILRLAGKDK